MLEYDLFGKPYLLVWGGSLELYSIQKGSLTGMQYGYGSLGIIVYPFAGALDPEFILMVDNDQLRRARRVRGFLGGEIVQRMGWLARPPDMNPIGHV